MPRAAGTRSSSTAAREHDAAARSSHGPKGGTARSHGAEMQDDPAGPATRHLNHSARHHSTPFNVHEEIDMTTTAKIQELRRRTGAGMLHCKTVLETTRGDVDQAVEQLRQQGITHAETRASRRTSDGLIASYVHHNGRLGALVEVNCETDFVARTDDFAILAQRLAEHVAAAAPMAVTRDALPPDVVDEKRVAVERAVRAAGKPESLVEKIIAGKMEAYFGLVALVDQRWVRDSGMTIAELINEVGAKTGENIQVRRFARFHMGVA
jgi:elongation factor Ts